MWSICQHVCLGLWCHHTYLKWGFLALRERGLPNSLHEETSAGRCTEICVDGGLRMGLYSQVAINFIYLKRGGKLEPIGSLCFLVEVYDIMLPSSNFCLIREFKLSTYPFFQCFFSLGFPFTSRVPPITLFGLCGFLILFIGGFLLLVVLCVVTMWSFNKVFLSLMVAPKCSDKVAIKP